MSPLSALVCFGLPLFVGWAVLRAQGLRFRTDPLALLGWSWCVGAFVTGLVVFGWLWTAPDTTAPLWPAVALAAIGALALLVSTRVRPLAPPPRDGVLVQPLERGFFFLAVAGVVVLTLARVLLATLIPIVEDDEANFWALKAQMLFTSSGFTEAFRAVATEPNRLYNADYPIFNPCLQVWTFAHAGELTHVLNRLPIQLFGVALIPLLAAALRRVVRPAIAALLLVTLASVFEFGGQLQRAHGDLMVGLGALIAADAWLRWRDTGGAAWFRLGCFGLAFLLWSKNEGLLMFAALCGAGLLVLVVRRSWTALRPRARWAWFVLPLGVIVLNQWLNRHYGWVSGFMAGAERDASIMGLLAEQFSERVGPVTSYYAREILLDRYHSGGLLLLFLGLCVLFPRRVTRGDLLLPALTVLAVHAGTMLVFIGAPHELTWHLTTAAQRVAFQPLALVTLWVGAAAGIAMPILAPRQAG